MQAKTGKSKVFYYYFDQHADYPKDSPKYGYGSSHGQEVAYVFQHLDVSKPDITKADVEIADAMSTYWTNFAKYGTPNGKGITAWPAFTSSKPNVMYFSATAHAGPVPSAASLKVLDAYFAWRRTAEGKEWAK